MDDANLVKCKGCSLYLEIDKIQNHLSHSLSCKKTYTEEEVKELNTMADSYLRKQNIEGKRKKHQRISKEKKKKQKTSKVCCFLYMEFHFFLTHYLHMKITFRMTLLKVQIILSVRTHIAKQKRADKNSISQLFYLI